MIIHLLIAALQPAAPPRLPLIATFDVDGTTRRAIYYPGESLTKPVPLVFVFHGHGQSGQIANKLFDIEDEWPEALVIYPDGIEGIGEHGTDDTSDPGWQKYAGQIDAQGVKDRDLKFFDKMLDTMISNHQIDKRQIFVVGFSNGARFTYLLWAERGNYFAALAAFSSQIQNPDLSPMLTTKPIMVGNGLNEPNMTPQVASASFAKVIAVNKVDKTQFVRGTGIHKGITYFKVQPGGAETIQWSHMEGHAPPQDPGREIVRFFKRHALD